MTRKEALLIAIKNQTNPDVIEKLQDIYDEEPSIRWSKKKILDAVEQFILDNNRLPYTKEMNSIAVLPPHSNIRYYFNMSCIEFFNAYFPDYMIGRYFTNTELLLKTFKKEYARLNYPTYDKYNSLRSKNLPCAPTIIKRCNMRNWKDLITQCGFIDKYNQQREKEKPGYIDMSKITCTVHRMERTAEEYDEIYEELKKIIYGV